MFTKWNGLGMTLALALVLFGCSNGLPGPGDAVANKALVAKLAGGAAQGTVTFDNDDGELEIEVTGGTPGATLEVMINGQVVAVVTLDDMGAADVEFDTDPDDPGELDLADDFAGAVEGDDVQAGDMSGSFEEEEDESADDDDDDGDDGEEEDADDDAEDSDDIGDDEGDEAVEGAGDDVGDVDGEEGYEGDDDEAVSSPMPELK